MTEIKTVKVPAIVTGPFVPPWRHPRVWWKTRRMRADFRRRERELGADPLARAVRERAQEALDRALLEGDGPHHQPRP